MAAPLKSPPKVLIVEDEFMVALFLEQLLEDAGFEIAATIADLNAALRAVDAGGFDIAIPDINIAGKMSYPVADALRQRGIPFFSQPATRKPTFPTLMARSPACTSRSPPRW